MQTIEPPFAQRGEVKRKTAERPSQVPISRIRGLEATSGLKDVQLGMWHENQSWDSVNLYPLISSFVVESWSECECMQFAEILALTMSPSPQGFSGRW